MSNGKLYDPALRALVPEQVERNQLIQEQSAAIPPVGTVSPDKLRRFRVYDKEGQIKLKLSDAARNETLKLSDRDLTVRIFDVETPAAVLVHFHGGGWIMGSIYEQEKYLTRMSQEAGVRVVSVDYPLAPETQLPEIVEVAFTALCKIADGAPDLPILIGGESAGAHISLSVLLRLCADEDRASRCSGAYLCYGIFDLGMTPSQRVFGDQSLGLSTEFLEWFYKLALPGLSPEQRRAPELSPLFADLSSLPPTHLIVGELDPLLDDTLFLHQRLLAAGNDSQMIAYPEAPHGFNGHPTEMGKHCNASINAFLKSRATNA
ncbi:MAG: alpha/beta hydrolase [Pseudomonadota bacterium]